MEKLISYIRELKKEFETQDTDGQAHPRFWVIADYRREPRPEGWHSDFILCLPNCDWYDYTLEEFINDAKENAKDLDLEVTREFLEDLQGIECEIGALEFAKKHFDGDAYLVPFAIEMFIVPNTFFLTKQDAKDYLKRYGYNHSPKAHTYAMTAIRSPKYEQLIDLIMEVE